MSVPIALRNLFEGRTRFVMSAGGVALAMLLVLVLDGVFAGAMRQVTAYMDNTDFDLIVAQEGVRNMHMTVSYFPRAKLREIRRVPGVAEVDPILYTTDFLVKDEERSIVYVIGSEPGEIGGPWTMSQGRADPGKDGIIVDERIAARMRVGIGDKVTVMGRDFRVTGLTRGTVSITNSIAFVRLEDFEAARGLQGKVSYALVRTAPGVDPAEVTRRIGREVGDVSVQTKDGFADSERRIIQDMSVEIMRMMNLIALLIGLAVVGLTVYTATLAKLREYGILKALGSGNLRLVGVVLTQAAVSLAAAMAIALGLAWVAVSVLDVMESNVRLVVENASVIRVAVASAVIGAVASVIPIARVARVDPVEVFRR